MNLSFTRRKLSGFLLMASLTVSAQQPIELAVRMDDMGAFHSVNKAVIEGYTNGISTSVELMPVTSWFPEAVKMLKQTPGLDVGIHLVFTSEWENVKWRPLTHCPSLVDENGYFLPMMTANENYPGQSIAEHKINMKEVEQEFRAQIEMVLKNVPSATHISGHMGSTILTKELNDLANKLAAEYGLVSLDKTTAAEKGFEYVTYAGPHKTLEEKENSFIQLCKNLSQNNTGGAKLKYMFIDHPSMNDEEMESVFHIGYENVREDRYGVTKLLTSARVQKALKAYNIKLINVTQMTHSLPREENVSMARAMETYLAKAKDAGFDIHSIMILQHGKVLAEKWQSIATSDQPHILNSLSKTFTSTAAGFAVAEGKLKVTDKVISFFPDKLPAKISDNLRNMTVKDLLTMTCGHEKANTTIQRQTEKEWVKEFLALPIPHKPGTHYAYNGIGTYMVSAVVQAAVGEKLMDYLTPRLFRPLGIVGAEWLESPQGINTGGWGLFLKTEDLAKFGQFYLQKGKWNGKQLLPESWIEEASSKQVDCVPPGMTPEKLKATDPSTNDWLQGYGYQIWRCRHNAYRADGARGQFVVVMPDQDAVVAITANVGKTGDELNLLWDVVLPELNKNK